MNEASASVKAEEKVERKMEIKKTKHPKACLLCRLAMAEHLGNPKAAYEG